MPRREIIFEEGCYYHFYNRGNNRNVVFFEPENYDFFLRRWEKYISPYLDTIVYALLPTHYHILVRVKTITKTSEVFKTSEVSPAISKALQKFSISYTKAINKRYERVGALFQGAYKVKPVSSVSYLLHLCRYIHGNPVKDGLVADPADWAYSNYLEWIGEREGSLFDPDFFSEYVGNPADYRDFVFDDLLGRDLPEDIRFSLEGFL